MTTTLQKICTKCKQPKPAKDYLAGQGRCKACRAARAAAYRQKKQATVSTSKKKPGSKPRTVPPPPAHSPDPIALPTPPTTVAEALAALDGRDSLETHIKQQMAATSAYYDTLIAQYQEQYAVAKAAGLVNEAAKATNGLRSAIKDKDASNQRIVKQFQLMAELNKPLDKDPRFAPIRFVLNACPPPESIVPKKYHVLPEDIQEGQKVTP